MLIVLILYCKLLLLLLRWDIIRVRLGTGLVVWVGLRVGKLVNSVIINVITEIIYRCNFMQVFCKI